MIIRRSVQFLLIVLLTLGNVRAQKNVLKVSLTDLLIPKISVSYERALNPNLSLAVWGGLIPNGSSFLYEFEGTTDDTEFSSDDFKYEGFSVTPELRFYPGSKKDAPKGFYLGAWGTYFDIDATAPYNYEIEPNESIDADGNFMLETIGGGLMLGGQWVTNSGISFDLLFGFGAGSANLDASVSDDRLDNADLQEIADELDFDLEDADLQDYLDYTISVQDNSVVLESGNFIIPLLRFHFAIGYAF